MYYGQLLGIYLQNSHSVNVTGNVVFSNNYASFVGGGIAILGSNISITGNLSLTDNNAGYQGGGMDMEAVI